MADNKPCIPDMLPIELDWEKLTQPITEATLEVGRFDGALNNMLNPNVLLSPLMMNEAVLSSRIEGTQVSLTEALGYEANDQEGNDRSSDLREVINYRRALQSAEVALSKGKYPINFTLIRNLHKRLMRSVRGGDKNPGEFRTEQNWIGKKGNSIDDARFIPPSPTIMHDFLENWMAFINQDYQSPLVQLALIHAQFEIIHPFSDGNGRLGRMIIPLFMYQKKMLSHPVFYISEYINDHDEEYRDRLLAITKENDWLAWVSFFLKAVTEQAKINNKKSQKISQLYENMKSKFREATRSQFSQSALDAFFKEPILSSTRFTKIARITTRPTATNILKSLYEEELIELARAGSGQTPAVYVFTKLIRIAEGIE
jgi:Fic family protein